MSTVGVVDKGVATSVDPPGPLSEISSVLRLWKENSSSFAGFRSDKLRLSGSLKVGSKTNCLPVALNPWSSTVAFDGTDWGGLSAMICACRHLTPRNGLYSSCGTP